MLDDGLSMVYSFYDPSLMDASLGTYVVLDHVAIAREAGLPYVYLGYWVPGSRKMGYKAKFDALEIYKGGALAWRTRHSPPGSTHRGTGGAHTLPDRLAGMSGCTRGVVVPDYDAIFFFVMMGCGRPTSISGAGSRWNLRAAGRSLCWPGPRGKSSLP
jgi:hypothetical protein